MKAFIFENKLRLPNHQDMTKKCAPLSITPKAGALLRFYAPQCDNASAIHTVGVGDRVRIGQTIVKTEAWSAVDVYASVSGTVREITQAVSSKGDRVQAIVIESDGRMEESPSIALADPTTLTREKFVEIIKEAGIVELDGTGIPAHVKLTSEEWGEIEYILINGAERDQYHTNKTCCMLTESHAIKTSLEIMLRLYPNVRITFALAAHQKNLIKQYKERFREIPRVSIAAKAVNYPSHVSTIAMDVLTVAAIGKAICHGERLTRRLLTLSGTALENPGNYDVCIGMSYRDIIRTIGGFKAPPKKIILGDAMTGQSLFHLDLPLTKTDTGLLAFSKDEVPICEEKPCIRCSRCVTYCPMGLMPYELNALFLVSDFEGFETGGGSECAECGSCSAVCPAKRHLAQSIRSAKKSVGLKL